MSELNINGKEDPYYRYKMPLLISHQAGRGNGCFTILDNLQDVTKAFSHPKEVVFKFMGIVLGASTNESKMSITGHYDNDKLVEVIYQYINLFVLCNKCNVPELIPEVEGKKKKRKLIVRCSACGSSYQIDGITKVETKGIDLLLKYLEKRVYTIIT